MSIGTCCEGRAARSVCSVRIDTAAGSCGEGKYGPYGSSSAHLLIPHARLCIPWRDVIIPNCLCGSRLLQLLFGFIPPPRHKYQAKMVERSYRLVKLNGNNHSVSRQSITAFARSSLTVPLATGTVEWVKVLNQPVRRMSREMWMLFLIKVRWLNGRASDYESGGSRFDPWVDRDIFSLLPWSFHSIHFSPPSSVNNICFSVIPRYSSKNV
ncbi:hypothetical protein L209DRAFT_349254 [Thermothelomyces heterothallicus CBS 203.75]